MACVPINISGAGEGSAHQRLLGPSEAMDALELPPPCEELPPPCEEEPRVPNTIPCQCTCCGHTCALNRHTYVHVRIHICAGAHACKNTHSCVSKNVHTIMQSHACECTYQHTTHTHVHTYAHMCMLDWCGRRCFQTRVACAFMFVQGCGCDLQMND